MSDERQEAIDRACDEWMATFKAFHATYGVELSVAEITVSEESFDAGYKAASPTPLQAAALAALVAWREADKVEGATDDIAEWPTAHKKRVAAERDLRSIADRLIAAEVTE